MRQLAVESGLSFANGPTVFENLGASDGRVDLPIFAKFVRHTLRLELSDEDLNALFRRLDILGASWISAHELAQVEAR